MNDQFNNLDKVPENLNQIKKRWGKKKNPLRKLVLWVLDGTSNPGFVILFGEHEIESKQINISIEDIEKFNKSLAKEHDAEISPGKYNILKASVEYSGYTILKGNNGHFPSLIDLKLLKPKHYDYSTRQTIQDKPYLVKKKGLYREYTRSQASRSRGSYYRSYARRDSRQEGVPKAATYSNIKTYKKVSLPYFSNLSYEDIIKEVKKLNIFSDVDLKLVDSPNDILELSKDLIKYLEPLIVIISSQNLYKRKKSLQVLIQMNSPKSIFEKILQIGSTETISGLFLELAKGSNSILEMEAKKIVASPKYDGGTKKCVHIYINSINSSLKEKRIEDIRQAISNLELIPESGTIPRGKRYYIQKKPRNMSFSDYVNKWGSSEWELIGPTITFGSNIFTRGRGLYHTRFKNLIQESEIFKLPDILGKLAHFADTPQFYYLLKNSRYFGFLIYIKRYIRRIIDNYAKTDEKAFITTLKSLFLSYKQNDTISGSRYGGSTPEYNMILKSFISPPTSQHLSSHDRYYYRDKMEPNIDSIDFKYQRKKRDYDNQIEIWRNNMPTVFEIALQAQASSVLDFCFTVVNNHPDLENTLKTITPKSLVQLSLSEHRSFSRMFRERLTKILAESEKFEPELMLALMACSDTELHNQAWAYFTRVKGKFTPEMISDLLLLKNLDNWDDFFRDRLSELKESQYNLFVNTIISKIYEFSKENITHPQYIYDLLNESTEEFNSVPKKLQIELINLIVDLFLHEANIPEWISTFSQNLIFSLSYNDLIGIVSEIEVDFSQKISSQHFNCIFYLLKAISTKIIPTDSEILDIIDFGTSKTVRMLLFMIDENKSQLKERFTTLLILFESDMVAFNSIAAVVFKALDKKAMKKMLSTLIDSPVKKAYSYATHALDEIYADKIPKDLIIQMLEHGSPDIKSYISDKISGVMEDLGSENSDTFIFYMKTLIFLPNLISKSKDSIYKAIPSFVINNKEKFFEVEEILLEIGGSNIIKDSERALVALAKIKMVME
ncbi:MAG: hypothetical protein ACTSRT_13630 [Promethearchaeota archaeon]